MQQTLTAEPDIRAFTLRRTLSLSAEAVGRRWIALALLVLLEWAVFLALSYAKRLAFHGGPIPAAASVADVVVEAELQTAFALAFILAVIGGSRRTSIRFTIARLLALAPAAFVVCLVMNLGQIAEIANLATPPTHRLTDGQLANRVILPAFGSIFIDVVVTAVVGVALPVLAAEGKGVAATLRRSFRLLRGERWRIVALWFGYTAATAALAFLEIRIGAAWPWFRALRLGGLATHVVEAGWFVALSVVYLELARGPDAARVRERR
ncbi:MAG TPA: hypothetical protein VKT30_03310 [Caulobacteraceae bacterium]|nr:hypothetical protein [Caulobacteraceae bacterium]